MNIKKTLEGRALLCATSLAAITMASANTSVFAQDTSAGGASQDIVVVTGSRIRSDNIVSKQPINTLDEDQFKASGAMTISDALNELPQLGASFGSQSQDITTLNRGFNAGAELINLRNLGAQRTLVLVNGRRHVGADPGTSSVDLNSIASGMIERIEIVTGANSAVYGADAVSGVVNVILKKDFEGTLVSGRFGVTDKWDAQEYAATITHGGGFANGAGSYIGSLEYTKSEGIVGADRSWARYDGGVAGSYSLSDGLALPVFATDAGLFTFDENGQIGAWPADAAFLDQRMPDRSLQLPTDRYLASARVNYDLSNNHALFFEGTYSKTKAEVQYEPQLFWFRNLDASQFDAPPIPDDNPYLLAFLADVGATALDDDSFNLRRLREYGPRRAKIDRDLIRIAAGVEGQVGRFDYELYYQYGRSDVKQADALSVDRNRYFAALFVDDNGTPADFSDDSCADPAYVALGCMPMNPFTIDPVSDDFLQYSLIPDVSSSVLGQQHVVSGYITGEAFEIPTGPVSFVLGAEYRDESTGANVHPSLTDGSNGIRQISVVEGGISVAEIFGEVSASIIPDRWNVSGALRFSHYDTVGGEFTWGVNSDFVVTDDLRLRASVGQATRAPNVNELFSSVVDSTITLADPCANDFNADNMADAGVMNPQTCVDELGAGYVISEGVTIGSVVRNRTGGNLDLQSETANTLTVGAVITPGFLPGFIGSIDYYDIKIKDVIGSLSTVTVIDQCYNTPDAPDTFCNLISRDSTSGLLREVNTQLFNIAEETVKGLDVQASYTVDLSRGALTTSVNYAHVFERSRIEFDGAAKNDFTGRIDAIKNSGRFGVEYADNRFSLAWTGRLVGSALAGTSVANLADAGNDVKMFLYHDLQASAYLGEEFTATLGVKNLTDKKPPLITEFSNSGLVPSAGITAGGVYDTRGRFMYLSVSKRF